ncbi:MULTISPECIES: glycosyltransferase family 4 protein [Micromonospora]|uniref:Glycosyl transferase family 1 n=1 Tax=Micromonospora sicca TaxID=2202420 RepID=A0A317DFV8_9ACTN|nr:MULTISPECIES: glycosyltransferase [unclassified Micromonospora]MBM0225777.1 glycosyltransferase family 4 protein [Micromonospora sp. ATA51]PWR13252.1 glycosyl transferase family 1 [Micromonospora sp. 4G51]
MAQVVITTESRFLRTPDGRVWVQVGPDHAIWTRYLAAFEQVRVVARVRDVDEAPAGAARVDGPGVEVRGVPYYEGPVQFLLRRPAIRRAALAAVADADAVILRVPSPIANLISRDLDRRGRPYACEAIGDPYVVLSRGVVDHPLRPVLRRWATSAMQRQCGSAVAVSYETRRTLQARYPASPSAVSVGISSVDLPAAAFVATPRTYDAPVRSATLVSVGSLEQLYKGIDTLVEALARLRDAGQRHRLVHVGVGRHQPGIEELIVARGLTGQVTLAGWLPSTEDLRSLLDGADLFVMPSRTEGLPRALIEAMARALPAIGSTAGGIPELLPAGCLVPPGDPAALATAIGGLLADPDRLAEASRRNLDLASSYSADVLSSRRRDFYQAVRKLSAGRAAHLDAHLNGPAAR